MVVNVILVVFNVLPAFPSYVVMLSLDALACGGYGATVFPETWQGVGKRVLISLSVILMTGPNPLPRTRFLAYVPG